MLTTIRQTKHYMAFVSLELGLIVQSQRKRNAQKSGGVRILPTDPQFVGYFDALENPLDDDEFNLVCKTLLNTF